MTSSFPWKAMYQLDENLYQGGKPYDWDWFAEDKSRKWAIISLIPDTDYTMTINFKFPIDDGFFPGLKWLETVISHMRKLEQDGYSLYVHCHAGVSRSVMVCAAYLMTLNLLTLDQAMEQIAKENRGADPNPYFMKGLKDYEKYLKGELVD